MAVKTIFLHLEADFYHFVSVEAFYWAVVDPCPPKQSGQVSWSCNIVSQALWGSIISSDDHETGDGSAETAEGDTVLGELDNQWNMAEGDVVGYPCWELLIGDSSSTLSSPS